MARDPAPPTLSRRKRILFSLAIVALLGVFAETTLQLSYRLVAGRWLWDWWAIPIYQADPVRVYRVKSNLDYWHRTTEYSAHYLTDDAGLRADGARPSAQVPKPPGTFRILALGPSFAFGWGVDYPHAYLPLIARGLQVAGRRVELVNLGTPSQPISYQLKWLREAGGAYEPDLIVQTVYGAGPDALETDDTLPADGPWVKDGYLYPTRNLTFATRLRLWRRYSASLFYGWRLYQALTRGDAPAVAGTEFYRKADLSGTNAAAGCLKQYQDYLAFVDRAVPNHPPVVFLYVPPSWVVRPADVGRIAHHGQVPDPFAARERNASLAGTLQTHHVHLIDTTPALIERDREGRTYYQYDTHFTVLGNQTVADLATPIIQRVVGN